MKLTKEQKEEFLRAVSKMSDEGKRLNACVRFGAESAHENFPEWFSEESSEVSTSSGGADSGVAQTNEIQSNRQRSRHHNRRVEVEVIGFVRWYNGNNGRCCGFVETNNNGIRNQSSSLIDVQIMRGAWRGDTSPTTGEWIVASVKSSNGIYYTNEARKINWDETDFNLLLNYCGQFSRIRGVVGDSRRGKLNYDVAIIAKCIYSFSMCKPRDWQMHVRNAVQTWLKSSSKDKWREAVDDLVVDDENLHLFKEIYFPKEEFEISDNDIITPLLQNAIIDKLLAKKIFSAISDLPSWYHLTVSSDLARDFLNNAKTEDEANEILSVFGSETISRLFDTDDKSIPLERRITLWKCSGNSDWIARIPAQFGADGISAIIKSIPEEERYLFIQQLPCSREDLLNALFEKFKETELTRQVVKDEWEKLKNDLPYVAFDLESDGETIREFAFVSDRGVQSYSGEDQLRSLQRALKRQKIIVGHNIRKWDLGVVLRNKSIEINPDAFIWDTLEIEILLNPCRYAYALHTTHKAEDDVKLTEELFFSQLYRLSRDREICARFKDFFPEEIVGILDSLQRPWFDDSFASLANEAAHFFQTPSELGDDLVRNLKKIGDDVGHGTALIVAPKELWGHIAHYLNVSFPNDVSLEYVPLSKSQIESDNGLNTYLKSVLERFIDCSKTPIPANLAQYLRIEYFSDDLLENLVSPQDAGIKCIDVDMIQCLGKDPLPENVYFIGLELVNRLHQYKLDGEWDAAAFIEQGCWIPMKLAASSYVYVEPEELDTVKKIAGDDSLDKAQNVWVERLPNDKYSICYSIDLKSQADFIVSTIAPERVHCLKWTNGTGDQEHSSFKVVTSAREIGGFDPLDVRVLYGTPRKDAYWTYQFKMLESVKRDAPDRPLVYILEDSRDVEAVSNAAKAAGYYLSDAGGLSKKSASLARHHNSMLVIGKNELDKFLALKSDVPYNFVWDNMAVEKCMMMWRGVVFGDEASLQNYGDRNGMQKSTISPRDAMLSAWPIFTHYLDLMIANNRESFAYLLDPYLDDYPELATAWRVGSLPASLWRREEDYSCDLKSMKDRFPQREEHLQFELQIEKAKAIIGAMLLPTDGTWYDYQNAVLEKVLSKKDDYIVSIPTGGGKSVLFQGPALYNSTFTNRLSIVITPLKALMEDQINGLVAKGFALNVDYLNGDRTYFETKQIYRRLSSGGISLLYVTPERFRSRAFINALNKRIAYDGGLEYFIFDEAHCVSQWGQEFRPDYLHVMDWCKELKASHPSTCVTLYSATVTGQIEEEVRRFLPGIRRVGQSVEDYNPIRNHISMAFKTVAASDEARRAAIERYIQENHVDEKFSRMLVFCLLRAQCEECADELESRLHEWIGITDDGNPTVDYFHAGMSGEEREGAIERFKDGGTPYLCATKAFGMGMDIPNVHYVVHYSPPRVLEDYLQEVGRAGRSRSMYEAAGFGDEHPIPAVCLVANNDFRRHVDKLKTSQLVWSNLAEVLEIVRRFIENIRPHEEAQIKPVVVPVSLWSKDDFASDTTMFRIALYWLEQLKRIKLGYSQPANILIELLNQDENGESHGYETGEGRRIWAVYERIRQISRSRGNSRIQVALSELQIKGTVNSRTVMDILVKCVKRGLIKIDHAIHCATSTIRFSEVEYVVTNTLPLPCPIGGWVADANKRRQLALHWVFKFARKMSSRARSSQGAFSVTPDVEAQIYAELQADTMALLDVELKDDTDAQGRPRRVMPWHDPDHPSETRGFFIAANYKKDFEKRRIRIAYVLLSMIQGVSVRDYIAPEYPKRASKSIRGNLDGVNTFLDELEDDCWKVLANIHKWTQPLLSWTELMDKCDLIGKGFGYFSNVIYILGAMGYIQSENLLPFGIEVYTTARTTDPIASEPEEDADDFPVKQKFDEVEKMRLVRLAAMATFSRIPVAEHGRFIQRYFQCAAVDDYMRIIGDYASDDDEIAVMLTDEALTAEVNRLDLEQRAVYDAPLQTNINVLAGPGSGKTHVLTLRCARLIYKEGIEPRNILVLAYNRAVVVELKNRLEKLFRALGMSRRAAQLHVHTFHALAMRICGSDLDGIPMEQWEKPLVAKLQQSPNLIRQILGANIQYVLIDEFQDITTVRLDAMSALKQIYPAVSFFTIGDKNQSIYGFERRKMGDPVSPDYYYAELGKRFSPRTFNMMTNYRSYQWILDAAANFIPVSERTHLPRSAESVMATVPEEQYVHFVDNRQNIRDEHWPRQLSDIVNYARVKSFSDIAIFFRTNAEVYRGYSRIKDLDLGDVRIRIQGQSAGELWRTREIYDIVHALEGRRNKVISFANGRIRAVFKRFVAAKMNKHRNWDRFYLDLAYTVILDCLNERESDPETFTYGDLADMVKDALQGDDGQIYKIYERYRDERIDQESRLNIVLTTMHKVKGLEFDAVVITPSFSSLGKENATGALSQEEEEDFDEEKRLLFVAYTRAKKYLRVYKWYREFAIESRTRIGRSDARMGYRDSEKLEKLYLGYLALDNKFCGNQYIADNVKRNDSIVLSPCQTRNGNRSYRIVHENGNRVIGYLSSSSEIVQAVAREVGAGQWPALRGSFVNDIFVWTYEDSVKYDNEHGTTFSNNWSEAAIDQGFVYVVDFAGYARERVAQ